MKICVTCKVNKPLSEFSRNKRRKDGHNAYCKICHKKYISEHYQKNKDVYIQNANQWKVKSSDKRKEIANKYARKDPKRARNNALKNKYGITLEDFNQLVVKQRNKCAICKNIFKNSRDAHLDHCHTTGKIRSVLCAACNKGLGHFRDSLSNLQSAVKYIKKLGGQP